MNPGLVRRVRQTMNCNGFQGELRNAVEQRKAAGRADLRAHADVCPRCALEWERHALLEAAIAGWKGGLPQVDLADRVMAHWAFDAGAALTDRLRSDGDVVGPDCEPLPAVSTRGAGAGAQRRHRLNAGRWAAVGAAVAALLILLSPLVWRPGDERRERPQVSETPAPRPTADIVTQPDVAPVPRAAQTVRVDAAVREAGTAWLGLANEATGTVREMAAFFPERTLAAADQSEIEVSVPQPARWAERLRNEIAPIQRDVGQAMDFLLEAVPLSRNRAI